MILTGRVRIEISDMDTMSFNIKRKDISIKDAIEVLRRVQYFFSSSFELDSFEYYEASPGETLSICTAWNSKTNSIRVSVTGLSAWDCSFILDSAMRLLFKDLGL